MSPVLRQLRFLVVTLCFDAAAAGAQTLAGQEKILVPLYLHQPLPGANGSLWTTDLWLRNNAQQPVDVQWYDYGCTLGTCPPTPPTPPRITFRPRIASSPTGLRGTFLLVDRQFALDVSFSIRVQDLSRQATTKGTEVPVVRESEFRGTKIVLPDVPTTANFRHVLRIYGFDGSRPGDVTVRVYGINASTQNPHDPAAQPDQLLGQATLHLEVAGPSFSPVYPAFTELADLNSIAPVAGRERVLVEVEPLSPDFRIWAFVSVVHNETQHLTVISPQ